jgi:xylulokinase
MHGLVIIDRAQKVVRPSIIWCDSRAVEIGRRAFRELGDTRCLAALLNSPGNFTASKARWVKEHEPAAFGRAFKMMLPGDYIALRMTGEVTTTISGLSEGILWDFSLGRPASFLLSHYGLDESLIPALVPTFGDQGRLGAMAANELGLAPGIPVTYRAGDQPNNALSLQVLEPGEVAATAGTSGVVYGVTASPKSDPASRVNAFAHVNHTTASPHIGILLCINGTGISNSWARTLVGKATVPYPEINAFAGGAPLGADGIVFLPFGNGAERMLEDRDPGAAILSVNFNRHTSAHLLRAVQEGVACSFKYGMDIMATMGMPLSVIRAGDANMFLSPVFCAALAGITGVTIELYNTDGAQGAARGAAIGAGMFGSVHDAFKGLERIKVIEPDSSTRDAHAQIYARWYEALRATLVSDNMEMRR